jgi:hypothetical protein
MDTIVPGRSNEQINSEFFAIKDAVSQAEPSAGTLDTAPLLDKYVTREEAARELRESKTDAENKRAQQEKIHREQIGQVIHSGSMAQKEAEDIKECVAPHRVLIGPRSYGPPTES